MGVLLMADEALGGEGGEAGMKNDCFLYLITCPDLVWGSMYGRRTGIHAAVAIHDTINTVVGTSPRNGLINDASCAFTLVCLAIYLYCPKCITYRCPKRICQTRQRCSPHPSSLRKPHIAIPRRRR
jgi:hypothetical protein